MKASYTIDLSAYDDVETLINELAGKAINFSEENTYYEFIDTASADSTKSRSKFDGGSRTIDLNDVRNDVAEGKTIADAFADRFLAVTGTSYWSRVPEDESEPVTGVKATSLRNGALGNSSTIRVM